MIKEWLDKLTDRYTHDPNSNIGKIIAIVSDELDDLAGTISTVESWRGLQQARGTTLDLIGAQFDQRRGDASSDDVYRILIRGKIAQSMSDGTANRIIQSLSHTFNCDPKEIGVRSANEYGMDEPGAVVIELSPPTILDNVDMPQSDFRGIIEKVIAAGITIYWDLITNFNVGIETAEIKGSSTIGYCGEFGCGGGTQIFGSGRVADTVMLIGPKFNKGRNIWPVISTYVGNGSGYVKITSVSPSPSERKGYFVYPEIPIPENDTGFIKDLGVDASSQHSSGQYSYIQAGTKVLGG